MAGYRRWGRGGIGDGEGIVILCNRWQVPAETMQFVGCYIMMLRYRLTT
jgi:hypothetical protein